MHTLPGRTAFPSPACRKIFRKPFLFGYKLSRLAGGRAAKRRRGSHAHEDTIPEAFTDNINGLKKGNHSCAWETPPALRATSPARRWELVSWSFLG